MTTGKGEANLRRRESKFSIDPELQRSSPGKSGKGSFRGPLRSDRLAETLIHKETEVSEEPQSGYSESR